MRVMITGAAGVVGTVVREALDGRHDLTLVDRRRIPDSRAIRADLARGRSPWRPGSWLRGNTPWRESMVGVDVLVHLTAAPRPGAHWRKHLNDGWVAARTACTVAAHAGVRRVVLASSHRVVRARDGATGPDPFDDASRLPGSSTPPRPTTDYGVTKAAAELHVRSLVDRGDLESAVCIRIGALTPDPPSDPQSRARWLPRPVMARIVRTCVEADYTGFHVIYGVDLESSDQFDLSGTRRFLGLVPERGGDSMPGESVPTANAGDRLTDLIHLPDPNERKSRVELR